MKPVSIRPFEESQLQILAEGFPEISLTKEDVKAERDGAITVVGAWCGGVPVGVAIVYWPGPRNDAIAKRLPGCPEFCRLFVDHRYRRRGIAAMIVGYVEEMARKRGMSRLGLGVGINNKPARLMYEKLGYVKAGIPKYKDAPGYDGEEDECVFMVRSL